MLKHLRSLTDGALRLLADNAAAIQHDLYIEERGLVARLAAIHDRLGVQERLIEVTTDLLVERGVLDPEGE
jgi:hypothetical protein